MTIDPQDLLINRVANALSMASFQHRVIANNIANVGTPGFVRQDVSFERVLSDLAVSSGAARVTPNEIRANADLKLQASESSEVGLESDMLALSVNTMRYTTLTRALARYLTIAEAVASARS